jgi:hypothetical protein
MVFPNAAAQGKPVQSGHHPIADHNIDRGAADGFPGTDAIGSLMNRMAPSVQACRQKTQGDRIVVCNQDVHGVGRFKACFSVWVIFFNRSDYEPATDPQHVGKDGRRVDNSYRPVPLKLK